MNNVKNLEDTFFDGLKKLDVNIYEIAYILRESFVRMLDHEEFEDYSKKEVESIIDFLGSIDPVR